MGTPPAAPAVTVTVLTLVTVAVMVEAGGQESPPATPPRGELADGESTLSPLELLPELDGPLAVPDLEPDGLPLGLVPGAAVESVSKAGKPLPEGEPELLPVLESESGRTLLEPEVDGVLLGPEGDPELDFEPEPKPEPELESEREPPDNSLSEPVAPEPPSELLPGSVSLPGVKPMLVQSKPAPCLVADPPEPPSTATGVDGHMTWTIVVVGVMVVV